MLYHVVYSGRAGLDEIQHTVCYGWNSPGLGLGETILYDTVLLDTYNQQWLGDILQTTWTELLKTVIKHTESLRNCHSQEDSKKTWQVIECIILEEKKDFR